MKNKISIEINEREISIITPSDRPVALSDLEGEQQYIDDVYLLAQGLRTLIIDHCEGYRFNKAQLLHNTIKYLSNGQDWPYEVLEDIG